MPRSCRRRTELGIAADLSNERSGAIVSYSVEDNCKMVKPMGQDFLKQVGALLSVRHKKPPFACRGLS